MSIILIGIHFSYLAMSPPSALRSPVWAHPRDSAVSGHLRTVDANAPGFMPLDGAGSDLRPAPNRSRHARRSIDGTRGHY